MCNSTIFMVLSSWLKPLREFIAGSFDKSKLDTGWPPSIRSNKLTCPPIIGSYRPYPPSPFIIITQPESWYTFYRPTEYERLSSFSNVILEIFTSNYVYCLYTIVIRFVEDVRLEDSGNYTCEVRGYKSRLLASVTYLLFTISQFSRFLS